MRVALADLAKADVLAVASRYSAERAGLGDEFLTAVLEASDTIGSSPGAWAVWPDIRQDDPPIRRYVMARFPYVIGFQVFPDHVWVVVVAYAARRPGYWR